MSRPGVSPGGWRLSAPDVPLSLSPAGICNRPAGSAGRPVEHPTIASVWRWEQLREVGVARGWIFVNGERFCPDTRHISAPQLLALAQLPPAEREAKIRLLLRRWFRPAHLRRRVRVLVGRSVVFAALNTISAVVLLALTAYIVADVPSRIPTRWSEFLAEALPWLLLALLLTHLAAVMLAWRSVRRLKPAVPEKRGSTLFGALLLPPQAMRLRAVLADGFFPPQHPLVAALALGRQRDAEALAFQTLADLRWPVGGSEDSLLARDITAWFRVALEARVGATLQAANIQPEALLAAPSPDAPASQTYCPRCRDQFVAGPTECPHRVPLVPLRASEAPLVTEYTHRR